MTKTNVPQVNIEKTKTSVTITGELPWEEFSSYKAEALKRLQETIKLDGFREGKVPEEILIKKIGEAVMLEEMAQHAISDLYPRLIVEHKIDALGRPAINITKLAMDNPLGFKIETAIFPEFDLPDFKKLAAEENKKRESDDVTEEDVQKTIDNILEMYAKQEALRNKKEGEEDKDDTKEETPEKPELTLELVQKFGDFKTIDEFKDRIKTDLAQEKKAKIEEKVRIATIEAIMDKTTLDIPEVLIESELENMIARMKGDIQNMGMTYEDYLNNVKKTEEELRKEWREDAVKRAKTQLIIGKIAQEEKLEPNQDKVNAEVAKITEQYKDVNPAQAKIYVENVLVNEEVFKLLGDQ